MIDVIAYKPSPYGLVCIQEKGLLDFKKWVNEIKNIEI